MGFLALDRPHLPTLEQRPPHQRHPFGRLLLAQSLCASLTLLSTDAAFVAYGCALQDARR